MEGEVYLIKDHPQLFDLSELNSELMFEKFGIKKILEIGSVLPVNIKHGQDAFLALKLQGWMATQPPKTRNIQLAFHSGSQSLKRIICTNVYGEVITDMLQFLGQDTKLKIEIRMESLPSSELFTFKAVMTPEMSDNQKLYSTEHELPQHHQNTSTWPSGWKWRNHTNTTRYSTMISLIVVASQIENAKRIKLDETIRSINEPENVRHSIKNLLHDKIATDITILTGEGTKIECHKCFLIANSSVFIPMLEGNFEEGRTHQIKMDDMTDRAARAFLNFLYFKDMNVPFDNPKIAVELLMASHKYQIVSLENAMKALLTVKPWEWFDIPSAIQLYFFAKNLDVYFHLRDNALLVLKLRKKELVSSEAFKELFENEEMRGAARELCTSLIIM